MNRELIDLVFFNSGRHLAALRVHNKNLWCWQFPPFFADTVLNQCAIFIINRGGRKPAQERNYLQQQAARVLSRLKRFYREQKLTAKDNRPQ